MPPVAHAQLLGRQQPEPSAIVAVRIAAARDLAITRQRVVNARLEGARLRSACGLQPADVALTASIATAAGLSARGVSRLLRVARTIADLGEAPTVRREHLEEAARFRVPSGPYAGRLAV
jgi:magnesium chelatase family protein